MEHGYYLVKLYNHSQLIITKFGLTGWEKFKSDPFMHYEIEWAKLLDVDSIRENEMSISESEWLKKFHKSIKGE